MPLNFYGFGKLANKENSKNAGNSGKQKTRESCLRITLIHKIRIQNPLGNSYRTLDYILKPQKMHKKQGIFARNGGVFGHFTH